MRDKPTAADTWDEPPIRYSTFKELFDLLMAHPQYELRPVIQASHDKSSLVKTIETQGDAEQTIANLRSQVMFHEEPFDELTEEQIELLSNHEFARDSREEVASNDEG